MSTQPIMEKDSLQRYIAASTMLEDTRSQIDALEQTAAVGTFHKQMELLQRRLLNDPRSFREMFIADGSNAIVWEFQQDELGADFTRKLWELMLRNDDASQMLMRFV